MSRKQPISDTPTKLQKFTSFFVLFFFLFNTAFQIPISLFDGVFANDTKYHDLVAVLVSETIYDDIEDEVLRYGKDIQGVLPNTKALIIPTPDDVEVFEVASLLEGLYYNGHKNLDDDVEYESRLVGTVLVGDIPVPLVYNDGAFAKTILPYVDFKDKLYTYSHSEKKYIKSLKNKQGITSEIWHGVISPNPDLVDFDGEQYSSKQLYDKKIDELKQYFDKDHDFYAGEGMFQTDKGVISGNLEDSSADGYEPYVFHYNQNVEQKGINPQKYLAYQAWLENREDIAYNRFSGKLSNRIDALINGPQDKEIEALFSDVAPSLAGKFENDQTQVSATGSVTPTQQAGQSDIQSMQLILGSIKKYIEIFGGPTIADLRKGGLYSGRYADTQDNIRVDTIPRLVTLMDDHAVETIKASNNELEEYLDEQIEGPWGLRTVVPLNYQVIDAQYSGSENRSESQQLDTDATGTGGVVDNRGPLINACDTKMYTHFSYGRKGVDIETTEQCSIYRGSTWNFRENGDDGYDFSGQTVEANRGRNVLLAQDDLALCGEELLASSAGITGGATGYWGGNSPVNLFGATGESGELQLGPHNIAEAIVPLFDIVGSKKVSKDELDYRSNLAFSTGSPIVFDSTGSAGNPNRYSTCSLDNYIQTYGFTAEESQSEPKKSDTAEYGGECGVLGSDEFTDITLSETFTCDTQHEVLGSYNGQPLPGPGSCYLFDPGKCERVQCRFGDSEPYYDSWADPGEPGHCDDLVIAGEKPPRACDIYNKRKDEICLDNIRGGTTKTHLFTFGATNDKGRTYKSPTSQEIAIQARSQFTPSLPIDAERYVEFFGRGEYNIRFFYPNFFRALKGNEGYTDKSPTSAGHLRVYLEKMTDHINEALSFMKPAAEIDLISLISDGGELDQLEPFESFGETKPISHYITLLSALHWYQLATPSNKYRHIFENHLNDQFDNKVIDTYELREDLSYYVHPENKKLYEIVYLNAPGDTQNMFIKMSPEQTGPSPFDDEIIALQNQQSVLLSKNVSVGSQVSKISDSCSPREGVALQDFIPAIGCQLDKTSPDKIDTINQQINDNAPSYNPSSPTIENLTIGSYSISTQSNIAQIESDDTIIASQEVNVFLFDEAASNASELTTIVGNTNTAKQKLLIGVANYDTQYISPTYPISVEITRAKKTLFKQTYNKNQLDSFASLTQLTKSGIHEIKITDADDNIGIYDFEVIPEVISSTNVQLSANIMESNGTQTQNYISLEDSFGNRSRGQLYTIEMEIDGVSIEFVDTSDKKEFTQQSFDGLTRFDLRSTQRPGVSNIKIQVLDRDGKSVLKDSQVVRVVDGLDIQQSYSLQGSQLPEMYVGENSYDIELEIRDNNGDLLEEYNSTAQISIHELYGKVTGFTLPKDEENLSIVDALYTDLEHTGSSDVEFVGGRAKVRFETAGSSGDQVGISLYAPGLSNLDAFYVDILPEKSAYVDLTLSKSQIAMGMSSASSEEFDPIIRPSDSAIAYVEMKDQFGNVVSNDNTTQLTLEIPTAYQDSIRSDQYTTTVRGGVGQFRIIGDTKASTAYFKVTASGANIGSDIEVTGQAPFDKDILDDIVGIRTGTPKILSSLGKKFFTESGPDQYISIFPKKQYLLNSPDFNSLPKLLQDQIEDVWDENNSYFIPSIDYGIGRVETSYFWRQDTIDAVTREPDTRRYNGLYSILLGASYGDYTQSDYLAGDLLFDDSNRALAVTSILNDPYEKNDVLQLSSRGGFKSVSKSSNLFQDIDFYPYINADNKLEVSVYNNALHIYIGSFIYNLDDIQTSSCDPEVSNIQDCFGDDIEGSQVVIKSLEDAILSYRGDSGVVLKKLSGNNLLEITTAGAFNTFDTLDFELNESLSDEIAVFDVIYQGSAIAQIGMNLSQVAINTSSNQAVFEQKSQTLNNTILTYFTSNRYTYRTLEGDNFSQLRLSYKDQFQSSKSLDEFHDESEHGFENSADLPNVGWENENKSLLSFSSGEHVGESIQPYMSFSTINLGDPVIGIKENFLAPTVLPDRNQGDEQPTIIRGFDASIGTILASRNDLEGYKVFDYNNDSYQDILLVTTAGDLELLENSPFSSRFRNRGKIAHSIDIGDTKQVFTGDFTGDGFEDIIFINNKSKPVLLNNYKTTFHRYDLEQDLELEDTDIILARVFDMDNDAISDLITTDSAGRLNIYYASDISLSQEKDDEMKSPIFRINTLDRGIGLTLNDVVRSDGGIVYFDGLYQNRPLGSDKNNIEKTSEEILQTFDETAAILAQPGGRTPDSFGIGEEPDLTQAASSLIDTTIFEEVAYDPNNTATDTLEQLQTSIENDSGDSNGSNERSTQALSNITDTFGDSVTLSEDVVPTTPTNFIRSAYAQYVGLDIQKRFTQTNSGSLASGSNLDVELTIKNTRNTSLRNIVYMESVEALLELDEQSIEISRSNINISKATQGYDFLIDGFNLSPGEEITIKYNVTLLPVSFGYLEVGYFEADTIGDDEYGDVILKSDHQNCGGEYQLYASTAPRSYQRDLGSPSCDPDKNQVPEFLLQNEIDEYGYIQVGSEDGKPIFERVDEPNGIPDYIDEQQQKVADFSTQRLLTNSCLVPDSGGESVDAPSNFPTDLNDVIWHGRNISSWKETASLGPISVQGDFISLPYDKAGEWPIGFPLDEVTASVGNAWIFYEENGQWHADTFEWMRPGQTLKFAVAVSGGGHIRSLPEEWVPRYGNTYGFMMSGLARNNVRNIEERSNISFYDCGGGDLISAITGDSDGDGIPDVHDTNPNYNSSTSGIDEFNANAESLSESVDDIIAGLCSGFGGGGSYTMPLNWAPLAPGSDPTLFGYPVLDGLRVDEGYPLFSTITGFQTVCGNVPCCLPAVHPVTSLAYVPGPVCGLQSAGGQLGTWNVSNSFRIYVTPTLTGSAGAAFCYGGPAITAGKSNPPGVSPIVPGGNCVVVAAPLFGDDNSDDTYKLDPASQGPLHWSPSNNTSGNNGSSNPDASSLGVVYGNCSAEVQTDNNQVSNKLTNSYVQNYVNFKQSAGAYNILPPTLQKQTRETLDFNVADIADPDRGDFINSGAGAGPLISAGPQSAGSDALDLGVSLDTSKLGGSFKDVVKIQNKSVAAFPDFLMDWVNRQIQEIVTKLTDFPTFHIILPDFNALLDSDWSDFGEAVSKAASGGVSLPSAGQVGEAITGTGKLDIVSGSQISGIQEAYEFLSQVPYINIEEEVVNIDLPWPAEDIDSIVVQWGLAAQQWEEEIEKTKAEWAGSNGSGGIDRSNFIVDADSFVKTLRRNVKTLKTYKDIPQDISELLSIKEVWIEQIITAVEDISDMMGGWIDRNGERFKNWVETYMLIKTILKSWQLIIDIFNTYNDQCEECRNERHDLQYFYWKLISIVIPDIPVIIFPKWPDIILDLHNVRVGLNVVLPDFNFNPRPLVLPRIPTLDLPSDPTITVDIPAMPLLPELDIPDLPRLPDIPTLDLPNIPQAPQIPKVLASFEGVLKILKLVVKMVCISRKSFFVPEWRAGDQIALITERNGYLPTDFIDLRLPQFSFPFVDAIKTTAYVNLEYDTDFIIEASKSVSSVLRVFSNDVINKLRINNINANVGIDIPDNVNIQPNIDGDIDVTGYDQTNFAKFVASGVANLVIYLNEQKDYQVTSSDFISLANNSISQVTLPGIPELETIRQDFTHLANYSFVRENEFIEQLSQKNTKKFDVLKQILTEEKKQNESLQIDVENIFTSPLFTKISTTHSDIQTYKKALDPYNSSFIKAATDLVVGENKIAAELQNQGNQIVDRIYNGTSQYSKGVYALAGATPLTTQEKNSCQGGAATSHKRNYRGVFVSEQKQERDLTYRLFNYMEELRGDEEITQVDIDNDGDIDVLYLVENHLYLKKNHSTISDKTYLSDTPVEIKIRQNKYYNGDDFYEVVDHFDEEIISSNYANVSFDAHANPDINHYRLEASEFIENTTQPLDVDNILFADLEDEARNNLLRNKQIVDIWSDVNTITLTDQQTQLFSDDNQSDTSITHNIYKNLNRISYVGNVANVQLFTYEMKNLNTDISDNIVVNIAPGTPIYAGNDGVVITYLPATYKSNRSTKTLFIPRHSNAVFDTNIKILSIRNDLYVETSNELILSGQDIRNYLNIPLPYNSQIIFNDTLSRQSINSRLELTYYDDTSFDLDARKISSYAMSVDTQRPDTVELRFEQPNGYYYATLQAFKDAVGSTIANDVLLAPQLQADVFEPELSYGNDINIPLLQTLRVDLSDSILEDSGIDNIEQVIIDTDISFDSDKDGEPGNDADVTLKNFEEDNFIDIVKTKRKLSLEFGPYREPIDTSIKVTLIDAVGNEGSQEIPFIVYAPTPEIISYNDQALVGSIDENIENIPVSTYRYRQGGLARVDLGSSTAFTPTGSGGVWGASGDWTGSGLTLSSSGVTIGSIDENIGSIDTDNAPLISYRADTQDKYPTITLQNNGEDVYYHYPVMGSNSQISFVENTDNITDQGIYITMLSYTGYSHYSVPDFAPYNPGASVIFRATNSLKQPLFTLYPDGRIDTLNEFYDIEYSGNGDEIRFTLVDQNFDRPVAEVYYHLGDGYILDQIEHSEK